MADLKKVSPTKKDGLTRQSSESYIMVDPAVELEYRHLRAVLTLGSMAEADIGDPAEAMRALDSLNDANDFLSTAIVKWKWLDRKGRVIRENPHNNLKAFTGLTMPEINWMLEAVSTTIKEAAASKKT